MKREEWSIVTPAISGPQGVFRVSTIRTYAGGAPNMSNGGPFTTKDYAKETPWPYETMVFGIGNSKGQYHQPHTSKEQAEVAHAAVISMIEAGTLNLGHGVEGHWGNPATTPKKWREVAKALSGRQE